MPEEQPEVGDVVKDISADISTLVKGEIALAKSEIIPQAKKAGIGAGLLAGYSLLDRRLRGFAESLYLCF